MRSRASPAGPAVAYAAAFVAFAFALPSLYWQFGGTAGLDTLGGSIEQLARARDPLLFALNGAAVVAKVAGGLLALALVRPWGRRIPRRLLLAAAWSGAALLTVYGCLQWAAVAAVRLGLFVPDDPVDQRALVWRLLVWEPWFVVWGLLLGWAALRFARG